MRSSKPQAASSKLRQPTPNFAAGSLAGPARTGRTRQLHNTSAHSLIHELSHWLMYYPAYPTSKWWWSFWPFWPNWPIWPERRHRSNGRKTLLPLHYKGPQPYALKEVPRVYVGLQGPIFPLFSTFGSIRVYKGLEGLHRSIQP